MSCSTDLDEVPSNVASADSLTDFEGVLNAAYYYQLGAVTPMAVMGDFRADNALMDESPYTEFDEYGPDLTVMEDQFFGPFYTALYKSILSANNVIENSTDATHIAEAKFIRGLSYFKLVQVFGDVSVILSTANIDIIPTFDLTRQPATEVYNNVIIPDLQDAINSLSTTSVDGRASKLAAQALLGKVYVHMGNFNNAEPLLEAAANGSGLSLQENYEDVFSITNELNSEIIFATRVSSSISDEYGFSEFWEWYGGLDTKSLEPLTQDVIDAYGVDDIRKNVNIKREVDEDGEFTLDDDDNFIYQTRAVKYGQTDGPDYDWIEIRLADVILLYAETLNENGASPATSLGLLDEIRERAGLEVLDPVTINTPELVRQAIQDERRLELAFEGQRWFDLVRTGTVDAEMEQVINPNYHIFPVPISEVLSSDGVITQNAGY